MLTSPVMTKNKGGLYFSILPSTPTTMLNYHLSIPSKDGFQFYMDSDLRQNGVSVEFFTTTLFELYYE